MELPVNLAMHITHTYVHTYRIAGFYHEDFNVASHGIRNIKIHYIFKPGARRPAAGARLVS